MDDDVTIDDSTSAGEQKGWLDRHPKLSILLIAAVFYIILIGMCGFVFVLLIRG